VSVYTLEQVEEIAGDEFGGFNAHWVRDTVTELEALRAQVATLTAEREEAQAACVAMREALSNMVDVEELNTKRCGHESSNCACALKAARAALATDAGAPILALLDECAAVIREWCESRMEAQDVDAQLAAHHAKAQRTDDLLTRLKARGPSRFVSIEKVREVAMKVARDVWHSAGVLALTHDRGEKSDRESILAAIVDDKLAEVTT
jgi:hypothetical protein